MKIIDIDGVLYSINNPHNCPFQGAYFDTSSDYPELECRHPSLIDHGCIDSTSDKDFPSYCPLREG